MQTQDIKNLPPADVASAPREVLRFFGNASRSERGRFSCVRAWLDAGSTPAEIAVIAPDIEAYWPVLQAFLEKEGVPTQKDVSAKTSESAVDQSLAGFAASSIGWTVEYGFGNFLFTTKTVSQKSTLRRISLSV